jgi:hypothetical protein
MVGKFYWTLNVVRMDRADSMAQTGRLAAWPYDNPAVGSS